MKAIVPQKTEALFSASEKQTAPEALVQLFLQNEENARNEESKTGLNLVMTFVVRKKIGLKSLQFFSNQSPEEIK